MMTEISKRIARATDTEMAIVAGDIGSVLST